MIKNYLLDTNILMHNANAIYGFEDNNVYLCGTVLQELDKHKNDDGEVGYNSRQAIRVIKQLMKDNLNGKPREERLKIIREIGLPLPNGGKLFFEPDGVSYENVPKGYSLDVPDNRIISSCVHMNKNYLKDNPVTLLTNDGGLYINALVCEVNAEDIRNEQVQNSGYTGHIELEIEDWTIIEKLYKENTVNPTEIKELNDISLYDNQFITITCGDKSILTVYYKKKITHIPDQQLSKGIKPLNKMQRYAMWALLNPEIPLVILEGPAGTSKTFLSLACGNEQLDVGDHANNEPYTRLLISRPNNKTTDADFGYLPGTLEEKMSPLMASYTDNLEIILGGKNVQISETRQIIRDLIENGIIEYCPLYTIRGRSIHNAYLICDEAQNATKNLIKDIVTRAGKNTKIIVAGDPSQIDNTSLDVYNIGLVHLKESMKGSPLCAIIKFEDDNCVRSKLAEEALKRMK